MTRFDIFDTIERLRAQGQSFCVATVVRTADATSAKAGAKAAITGQGDILGHLGGACVQRAVRVSAEAALTNGETRMIRVKPGDHAGDAAEDVALFDSGCPSGGTVDILIEAFRLPPRLFIFGDTPIARALGDHATRAGLRVVATAPDTFDPAQPAPEDFIVIASQGQGDRIALRAALDSRADRVSMIASAAKARVLTERLARDGVAADRLAALKAPAGLDLGAVDPPEIAISVLAELIQWRNQARRGDPKTVLS